MKKNASRLALVVVAMLVVIVACELAAGVPVAIPFVPINVLAQRTQACPVVDGTAGSGAAGVAVLAVADIGPDPCPAGSLIPLRVAPWVLSSVPCLASFCLTWASTARPFA